MNISINRLWTIIAVTLLLITLVLSYDTRLTLPVQIFKSGIGGLSVLILCLMLFRISEATSVYRLKHQYHLLADERADTAPPIGQEAPALDAYRIPQTDQELPDSADDALFSAPANEQIPVSALLQPSIPRRRGRPRGSLSSAGIPAGATFDDPAVQALVASARIAQSQRRLRPWCLEHQVPVSTVRGWLLQAEQHQNRATGDHAARPE